MRRYQLVVIAAVAVPLVFMAGYAAGHHADGKPDNVTKTGGGNAEGRATTHWAENTGKVPAIWIAVDIVPKP